MATETEKQIAEMHASLKVIHSEVSRIKKAVEGNGRKGLQDRVTTVEQKVKNNSSLEEDVDKNSRFRIGANAIIKFVIFAASTNIITAVIYLIQLVN